MKQIKCIVVVVAIAVIFSSSAFTFAKGGYMYVYGQISDDGLAGQSNAFHQYTVYDLADVSAAGKTDYCGMSSSQRCKFEIGNPILLSSSPTPFPSVQQQKDNNLIIISRSVDGNGVYQSVIWVKVGYIGPGMDSAGPANDYTITGAQFFAYF